MQSLSCHACGSANDGIGRFFQDSRLTTRYHIFKNIEKRRAELRETARETEARLTTSDNLLKNIEKRRAERTTGGDPRSEGLARRSRGSS